MIDNPLKIPDHMAMDLLLALQQDDEKSGRVRSALWYDGHHEHIRVLCAEAAYRWLMKITDRQLIALLKGGPLPVASSYDVEGLKFAYRPGRKDLPQDAVLHNLIALRVALERGKASGKHMGDGSAKAIWAGWGIDYPETMLPCGELESVPSAEMVPIPGSKDRIALHATRGIIIRARIDDAPGYKTTTPMIQRGAFTVATRPRAQSVAWAAITGEAIPPGSLRALLGVLYRQEVPVPLRGADWKPTTLPFSVVHAMGPLGGNRVAWKLTQGKHSVPFRLDETNQPVTVPGDEPIEIQPGARIALADYEDVGLDGFEVFADYGIVMLLHMEPDPDAADLARAILSHSDYGKPRQLSSTDAGLRIDFHTGGGVLLRTQYPPVRRMSIGAPVATLLCILTQKDLEDIANREPGVSERTRFQGVAGIGRAVKHLLTGTDR